MLAFTKILSEDIYHWYKHKYPRNIVKVCIIKICIIGSLQQKMILISISDYFGQIFTTTGIYFDFVYTEHLICVLKSVSIKIKLS